VFQLENTVGKDGIFRKPFTMFDISVAGEESSVFGHNGPLSYLALNWLPTCVQSMVGVVFVDGEQACPAVFMPALGPLEVHLCSDSHCVVNKPRQWRREAVYDPKHKAFR